MALILQDFGWAALAIRCAALGVHLSEHGDGVQRATRGRATLACDLIPKHRQRKTLEDADRLRLDRMYTHGTHRYLCSMATSVADHLKQRWANRKLRHDRGENGRLLLRGQGSGEGGGESDESDDSEGGGDEGRWGRGWGRRG